MEQINRVVITRKEEKEVKKLERLFSILGIDYPKLSKEVEDLKEANISLHEEVKTLREENENLKKEYDGKFLAFSNEIEQKHKAHEELIRSQMNQIAVNIQKSTASNGSGSKPKFTFTGRTIDESF